MIRNFTIRALMALALLAMSSPAAAGPVRISFGDVCLAVGENLFKDPSAVVAYPSCAGATAVGVPVAIAALPAGAVAGGVAAPFGGDFWELVEISASSGLAFGGIAGGVSVGGPVFVAKHLAWELPRALLSR